MNAKRTIISFTLLVLLVLAAAAASVLTLKNDFKPLVPEVFSRAGHLPATRVADGAAKIIDSGYRHRNVSPDGKQLVMIEQNQDPHGPDILTVIKLIDLATGSERALRIERALLGWYVNEFDNYPSLSEDAYPELRVLGWSGDSRYIFFTQKPNDEYNSYPRVIKFGDQILAIDARTGESVGAYDFGTTRTVYDSIRTPQSLLAAVWEKGGLTVRDLSQGPVMSFDESATKGVVTDIPLPADNLISGAMLSDNGRYVSYVLAEGSRQDGYYYSLHLFDVQKGIDYPLYKSAKKNQVVEVNNWYYDEVLNIKVDEPGPDKFDGLAVDVGKTISFRNQKDDILSMAFDNPGKRRPMRCVESMICIDQALEKKMDLGLNVGGIRHISVPVSAVGSGYTVSAMLRDSTGTVVAATDNRLLPYADDLRPQTIVLDAAYEAVPAAGQGTLYLTQSYSREAIKPVSIEIPVVIPKIGSNEIAPEPLEAPMRGD